VATPDVNADGGAGAKPLRADARRNRARVLEAADAVFDAEGVGASTEEVARRAGVGIGTVFRHFPTKEALLEAVLVERMRALAARARDLAGSAEPGGAFFGFLDGVVRQSATKTAFADWLAGAGVDVPGALAEVGGRLHEAVAALLVRAQGVGAVRADVGPAEVIAVLVGASRTADYAKGPIRDAAVAVIFDGLRPQDARAEKTG
jgi:AcrR family transcriptional regulator